MWSGLIEFGEIVDEVMTGKKPTKKTVEPTAAVDKEETYEEDEGVGY